MSQWGCGAFSQTNSVTVSLSNVSCFCDKNDLRVKEFPLAQLEDTVHRDEEIMVIQSTVVRKSWWLHHCGEGIMVTASLWWGNHSDCITVVRESWWLHLEAVTLHLQSASRERMLALGSLSPFSNAQDFSPGNGVTYCGSVFLTSTLLE